MLNKKGYTIVESIIAMLLIAIMVGAIFSSLMASRRAVIEPSYREEMLYAIESLENQLKNLVDTNPGDYTITGCNGSSPLEGDDFNSHDCRDLMPSFKDYCKKEGDMFGYRVVGAPVQDPASGVQVVVNEIQIKMVCNGEVL